MRPLPTRPRKPQFTLGQGVIGVALAAVPLALIRPPAREIDTVADAIVLAVFATVAVFLLEVSFWYILRPFVLVPLFQQGKPVRRVPATDPRSSDGIVWMDSASTVDGITWLE